VLRYVLHNIRARPSVNLRKVILTRERKSARSRRTVLMLRSRDIAPIDSALSHTATPCTRTRTENCTNANAIRHRNRTRTIIVSRFPFSLFSFFPFSLFPFFPAFLGIGSRTCRGARSAAAFRSFIIAARDIVNARTMRRVDGGLSAVVAESYRISRFRCCSPALPFILPNDKSMIRTVMEPALQNRLLNEN